MAFVEEFAMLLAHVSIVPAAVLDLHYGSSLSQKKLISNKGKKHSANSSTPIKRPNWRQILGDSSEASEVAREDERPQKPADSTNNHK
jgi:BRCT domain type II-containing protein